MGKDRKRTTKRSLVPPDGGWGWVVAIGSNFSLQCATFIRCMGVFFNEWRHFFDASATEIAVVGSVHMAAFLFMGPAAGYLCNRFGSRKLAILGGAMTFTSLLITSYAKNLLHIILSLGVLGGVGSGFVFISSVTIITKYFKKRYATANSISNSGLGLSFIILPLLARLLIDLYSWNGAMFIFAAASANICVCGMLFRPVRPSGRGSGSEETPQVCVESGDVSFQDEGLNNNRGGSRGNVYRKRSSPSDGEPRGPDETDLGDRPAGRADRPMSSGRGLESELEGVAKTTDGLSDGKPQRKVSISPDYVAETVSPRSLPSESCGCSENHKGELPSLPEGSASGTQLNGESVNLGARLEKRRPTAASIYLGHIARGTGCFLFKTRLRFGFFCLMQAAPNVAISATTIHFVPMTIEAGISKLDAAILMSIFGVGNLVGRLMSGPLIDCKVFSTLKMYFCAILTCGVSMVVCPSLHTFAGYLFFALVFGYVAGTYKSLPPVLIREFVGQDLMPLALGVYMPFIGIGTVTGPTFAGWLYDLRESYDLAFYITGGIVILSSWFLLLIPYLKRVEDRRRRGSDANDEAGEEPAGAILMGSIQSVNEI